MRNVARFIAQADENQKELFYVKSNNRLLNKMLFYKDSIHYEDSLSNRDSRNMLSATNGLLTLSENQRKELQHKYTHLKVNDRLKVGIFATIVAGLVYVYIEKK